MKSKDVYEGQHCWSKDKAMVKIEKKNINCYYTNDESKELQLTKNLCMNKHDIEVLKWKLFVAQLFPLGVPNFSTWTEFEEIFKTLNHLVPAHGIIDLILPTDGNFTWNNIKKSEENYCIEFCNKENILLKPLKLSFVNSKESDSSFFIIESAKLDYSSVYENYKNEEYSERVFFDFESKSYYKDINNLVERDGIYLTRYFRGTFIIACSLQNLLIKCIHTI